MRRRQHDDEEPPLIPGYEAEGRQDQSTGIHKVLGDPRAMLALPMIAAMIATMPALTSMQRAEVAWDHIDALLEVRKQKRAEYIQGLKDRGEYRER